MPYIAQDRRQQLDPAIEELQERLHKMGGNEGDLNYVVSRLIGSAFQNETRYHMIARVSGVLRNVYSEFYRRLAVPYEDTAIAKNGDIPEYKTMSKRLVETLLQTHGLTLDDLSEEAATDAKEDE